MQIREDNYQFPAFIELPTVDSTNNYALSLLRNADMTERQLTNLHKTAIFAHEQYGGKGQRGKTWLSARGQNIHLSLIIMPKPLQLHQQFSLTALTALATREFMEEISDQSFAIKWPNDIYFQDRKAGGILIENIISGREWKWAVIGVGLNINQTSFEPQLQNPVSLKQVTGKDFDCLDLARRLADTVFGGIADLRTTAGNRLQVTGEKTLTSFIENYNKHLYKRGKKVKLKKGGRVFEATVKEVTEHGQLVVEHGMEERFDFGEVSWVLGNDSAG